MNTKTIVKALAALALAASTAHAATLPLQGATITATYNGDAAGMLGLDHQFATEAGSNVSGLDPTNSGVEFFTADFLFGIDLAASGALTVIANGAIPIGTYSMQFDFGSSLASPVSAFTFVDASGTSGVPVLSIIDAHTIALDLTAVQWSEFGSLSAEVSTAAVVPEPSSIAMLLAGLTVLGGSARVRRLRQPGR